MSKIVKGTMLLTGATFLSKLLGMLYVIPFEAMVEDTGGTLYSFAYIPYTIFISISTLGVPLAVSKFVSKYNALGDYETGRQILKSGMQLMALTGLVSFLLMFFGAEWIAHWSVSDTNTKGNSIEDVTMVIRMVSFALLIIPGMSIVRGFFQGYESMAPTAVSQVVEQIVRIVFLLGAVFIITEIMDGSIQLAVSFATFAAFIGALASAVVLFIYWRKRKPYLDKQLETQEYSYDLSQKSMIKELLMYAGPFVLVGVATPIYQVIDQFTFEDAMVAAGLEDQAVSAFAAIILYGHKLVIIPVTLATGLSLAILPAITKSFTEEKKGQLFKQINQALQIVMLLILPAVAGLSILSSEAYGTIYGMQGLDLKGTLLGWYAPVALLLGMFTVSASILQGISQQNFAVISLGAGLLIKACLNIPLILVFGPKGSIFATGLAVGTAVLLNLWRVKRTINIPLIAFFKRSLLMLIFTGLMAVVVFFIHWGLGGLLNADESRIGALVTLLVGVGLGAAVYLWLAYKSTLLERVLGGRIGVLDRFLKRNKGASA
ncbi:putative polysaccharide biosynthesis protein [Thalassobacillus hwangdonensis]|uniref:Oligosaccharide flippase family protein n=1 Tax=Thalassobacillus hwangdonensis TaxID=546108 RepID=A0ABW3L356_9BACI